MAGQEWYSTYNMKVLYRLELILVVKQPDWSEIQQRKYWYIPRIKSTIQWVSRGNHQVLWDPLEGVDTKSQIIMEYVRVSEYLYPLTVATSTVEIDIIL